MLHPRRCRHIHIYIYIYIYIYITRIIVMIIMTRATILLSPAEADLVRVCVARPPLALCTCIVYITIYCQRQTSLAICPSGNFTVLVIYCPVFAILAIYCPGTHRSNLTLSTTSSPLALHVATSRYIYIYIYRERDR